MPNIMVMLTKQSPSIKTTKLTEKKSESVDTKSDFLTTDLTHEDPLVQEYYNSLTPNEKIAHTIAKEKLGTSYDVSRTHGFLRWQKARK
jgi:hypothetical protein